MTNPLIWSAGAQHLVAAALVLRRGRVALHQLTNRVLELGMVVGPGMGNAAVEQPGVQLLEVLHSQPGR